MKTAIFILIVVSLTLLVSATVWEGVTDVISAEDMPGNYSVATNSFPKNSVVDITNLENGKMVRALVVSGLETRGLLAKLSRNTANSIDLRGNSTCRVRITRSSDDIALSRFKLGPITAPPSSASEIDTLSENNVSDGTVPDEAQNHISAVESDFGADSAAVIGAGDAHNRADDPIAAEAAQAPTAAVTEITPQDTAAQTSVQTVTEQTAYAVAEPVIAAVAEPVTAAIAKPFTPAALDNPPESGNAGNLGIIPSEERIPEAANRFVIAPEERAPPLKKAEYAAASPAASDFSPFQVPLISRLEQGKCYVQVAAYQRVEHVEDAISRIGTAYPLAIQNIGSDANPMFRVLLGPLNQGESGAMLQRFKSIGYNDAFIRYN